MVSGVTWIVVRGGLLRGRSDTDKRGLHSCHRALAARIHGRDTTSRCSSLPAHRYKRRLVAPLVQLGLKSLLGGARTLALVIFAVRMSEPIIKSAESKKGAPGRLKGAWLPMKNANINVKSVGPITPVRPMRLPLIPCSAPCSDGPTRRVIRPCNAGWTNPMGA